MIIDPSFPRSNPVIAVIPVFVCTTWLLDITVQAVCAIMVPVLRCPGWIWTFRRVWIRLFLRYLFYYLTIGFTLTTGLAHATAFPV
jgi:hypothetical protein